MTEPEPEYMGKAGQQRAWNRLQSRYDKYRRLVEAIATDQVIELALSMGYESWSDEKINSERWFAALYVANILLEDNGE